MKTTQTPFKAWTACWLILCSAWLMIPAQSFAQTVIGSWQNDTGDGWIDWGNTLSITNSANTNKYGFVSGAVAGYAQSLQISQAGYNQNLAIKLESIPGGMAAFLQNHLLSFTFSVPSSASSGSTGGYSQLYALALNASGYGFNNIPFTNFTATGTTGGNSSGGQPNFYFYSGSPVQTQTVTVNYSNILSAITATTNSGYIELIFTFNNGGGAPTNYFINNVVLSGAPAPVVATTNYVVNEFNTAFEVTNVQTSYDSQNGWANWFGDAFVSVTWDPTSDVSNNPASGSMKVVSSFSESTDENGQYVVFDGFGAITGVGSPQYTNLQFSIRYAANSLVRTNNGSLDFGSLQVGTATPTSGQDYFGTVVIPATNSLGQPNTNWITVNIPLNSVVDPVQTNIQDVLFHNVNGYYGDLEGTMTYWVDNIRFVGPGAVVTVTPPTLAMTPAKSGLRIFAGSTANNYDREELATADSSQSWVGGTYPVSYSYTLLDYPANIGQTHIFLVPVNTSGQANMGNAGTVNEFIEYQASNTLWMILNPAGAGGVVASVQWKTNLPNANPNITALAITNATAVGTWTLKFTSASTGTLTAPGASPVAFTLTDPNVTTDFANPLVAYFGVQPNTTAGEGQYEDWASISVTNVAGANENENFATEASFNQNGYWVNNSAQTTSLQPVPASALPAYWASWTLPAFGYALGASDNLTGSTLAPYPWVVPEYYNNYNGSGNGTVLPGIANQGLKSWVLIPSTCLPTADGQPQSGQPLSPTAFFKLFNPALNN